MKQHIIQAKLVSRHKVYVEIYTFQSQT